MQAKLCYDNSIRNLLKLSCLWNFTIQVNRRIYLESLPISPTRWTVFVLFFLMSHRSHKFKFLWSYTCLHHFLIEKDSVFCCTVVSLIWQCVCTTFLFFICTGYPSSQKKSSLLNGEMFHTIRAPGKGQMMLLILK